MAENKYIIALREAIAELDEDRFDPDEPYVKGCSITNALNKIKSPNKGNLSKSLINTVYNMKYNNSDKFYPSRKIEDTLYDGNEAMQSNLANAFISKLNNYDRQKLPYKKEEYVPYVMKLFKAV